MTHPAPASLGRRAVAYVLDLGIVVLLGGAILAGQLATGTAPAGSVAGADPAASTGHTVGLLAWVLLVCLVAVQWWTHGRYGWTLGKRALRLRTFDARTGRPLGLGRVLVRGLVVSVAGVVVVGPLVVLASPLLDRTGRNRGWHDRAVGAEVVDLRTAGGVPVAPRSGRRTRGVNPAGAVRAATARRASRDEDWSLVTGDATSSPLRPASPAADPHDAATRRLGSLLAERRTPGRGLVLPPLAEPGVAPDIDTRTMPTLRPAVFTLDPALEETRKAPLRADERPPGDPAPEDPHAVALALSDGRTVAVHGVALLGRNPAGTGDEQLIRFVDPARSVSKTHLQLGVDDSGLWVADRGSTNGTLVTLADGQQIVCGADQRVRVPVGSTVSFGDCGLRVVRVPAEGGLL
jgi:hypothetical protein